MLLSARIFSRRFQALDRPISGREFRGQAQPPLRGSGGRTGSFKTPATWIATAWLSAGLCAAQTLPTGLQSKRYGVLLLGEGGADLWVETAENGQGPWSGVVADARKAFGGQVPLEFAPGEADARNIQEAVDALEAKAVRQIVVVPLMLSSQSPVMDEVRFLLGLRETPSKDFLNAPHAVLGAPPERLDVKIPLVMSKALDDSPLLAGVIAAHAQAADRAGAEDALVLVGAPPASKDDAVYWAGVMASLADKAGRLAGFKTARAMALELSSGEDARDRSEHQIDAALRQLRRGGGVAVVPVELSAGELDMRLSRLLDGSFARYDGRPLLPDPKIVQWVKQSAEEAFRLPDMRLYKKEGGKLAPPPALTFEHKLSIPPQTGDKP